jgi:hypothetical protein
VRQNLLPYFKLKLNNMKNFKYSLAIEGTHEQISKLISKLQELSYITKNTLEWRDDHHYLLTNFGRKKGNLGFNQNSDNNYIVSASNPDLVLALAAMVDDDQLHVGELVTSIEHNWFKDTGGFRIIRKLNGSSADCSLDGESVTTRPDACYIPNLRKATKEEIINHFTPKTMEKKIIGYKLKDDCKQYIPALDAISCYFSNGAQDRVLGITSAFVSDYRNAGVLDLWFEPVYEEIFKVGDIVVILDCDVKDEIGTEPITGTILSLNADSDFPILVKEGYTRTQYEKIYCNKVRLATPEEIAAAQTKVIYLRCEGGNFEIEVSKKGIYYKPEDRWLEPNILESMLNHSKSKEMNFTIGGYKFTELVTHIDSGCKKQVPIEDWKKVLEAYDSLNK